MNGLAERRGAAKGAGSRSLAIGCHTPEQVLAAIRLAVLAALAARSPIHRSNSTAGSMVPILCQLRRRLSCSLLRSIFRCFATNTPPTSGSAAERRSARAARCSSASSCPGIVARRIAGLPGPPALRRSRGHGRLAASAGSVPAARSSPSYAPSPSRSTPMRSPDPGGTQVNVTGVPD